MKLLLVNGPNLNTLGTREPAIYGTTTLEEVVRRFHELAGPGHLVVDHQSNHEGSLIDFLQRHADADGCVINPGGRRGGLRVPRGRGAYQRYQQARAVQAPYVSEGRHGASSCG
jgi:hypothetical protein